MGRSASHGQVMRQLSASWKARKAGTAGRDSDTAGEDGGTAVVEETASLVSRLTVIDLTDD